MSSRSLDSMNAKCEMRDFARAIFRTLAGLASRPVYGTRRAECRMSHFAFAVVLLACRGTEKPDYDTAPTPVGVTKTLAKASGIVARNVPVEDGQWTMASKDYANTRYSGLEQIS